MNAQQYEEAQWFMLKNLWERYGLMASVLVLLATAIFLGNAYWHTRQENRRLQASVQYEQLLSAVNEHEIRRAERFSQSLMRQYTDTPYAALAGLLLARQAVEAERLDLARQQLHWVLLHSQGAVKNIAQIRYARVLMAMNKPHAAQDVLNKVTSTAFESMVEQVRHDHLLVR